MDKPKRNWFRRHWIITTFLFLIILLALILIAFDSGVKEKTKSKQGTILLSSNQNTDSLDEGAEEGLVLNSNTPQKENNFKDLEKMSLYQKLNECTKLCAGEDIDILLIKNECYSSCYQIYYTLGEKELDIYIQESRVGE